MAVKYSTKQPDMGRNTALAGKTVYSNGMNVTYDSNGYATKATNPDHGNYAGTTRSVHAQDKDAALRGESWTPDYTGLVDWGDGTGMGSAGSRDTRASRSTGGTGSAYDGSYGAGYLSAYDARRAAYDAQRAAYEAAVRRAVAQLTAQKTAVNESYDDYARQAYRDKMGAERDIGQYLGARGMTGGAAESTLLGLNTSYADELRKIEQSRRETLSGLDQAISDARLTGDLNSAQAAADAAKEQAALYAQEMQERKAAEAAQEQYARAEAQQQQSWARTLAGQMLAAGRMPDDATLAAAGITRAQAELLLSGTESSSESSDAYVPGFSRAQVLDAFNRAQKNGQALTGNLLRDYNYYIHNDPDYSGGGSAYSGTGGTSSAIRLPADTTRKSYDNGGYSTTQVKELQRWLKQQGYNIDADGYWGPESKSATRMSVAEAMARMYEYLSRIDGSGSGFGKP